MKAQEKKTIIFKAAVNVLVQKGITHFSIQNICTEAGISKGGFLYHFSTKEDLLKGLEEYLAQLFRELIEDERKKRDSYAEAYIYACLTAAQRDESRAFSSLNSYNYLYENSGAWQSFYSEIHEHLSKELPNDWITLIGLTTDGLWKNGQVYTEQELTSVQYLLLDLIKKPS